MDPGRDTQLLTNIIYYCRSLRRANYKNFGPGPFLGPETLWAKHLYEKFQQYPTGLGTIPIGIRSENPLEFHWKMFENSEFITSHLRIFRNF